MIVRVKLDNFLKKLGVSFNYEINEFEINADDVIGRVEYNDFPKVKCDENVGLVVDIVGENGDELVDDFRDAICGIKEFVEIKKEDLKKIKKEIERFENE